MPESLVYLFSPTVQFMNVSGKPLVDGYVNIFISGTRSKYYAYSDFEGTLHPFNIPLNALGSAVVLVSPAHSYDVYVYNSLGVLQMSRYNITPATGEGTVITYVTTLTSTDNTVDISVNSSTEYDLSIANQMSSLKSYADQAESDAVSTSKTYTDTAISNKKDKQSSLEFTGSAIKTVKKITQNANGELNVEFEDIAGSAYIAGDAIDLTNNAVSVKYSKGLEVNSTNELQVKVGQGLFLTQDGVLTTEEPEENYIDITNEWEFDNGFRLQYGGQTPGEGNDMHILYSPVSDIVKFTSDCRINRTSPLNGNYWCIMLRYKGNRFYTSNNTTNPEYRPKIANTDAIGGVNLVIGTDSRGSTSSALLKFGYVGSSINEESDTGLAIQNFINPSNVSVYGTLLSALKLKVTKKV